MALKSARATTPCGSIAAPAAFNTHDRLSTEQLVAAFPEVRADNADLMNVDVICDVAIDGLKPFADKSCDFIIASHVVEHLPNPLGALAEFFRALKPGGVLYLGLPDKNFTFDRDRQCTPLQHLIDDRERGVTTVEEHHLVDWCVNAVKCLPDDPHARQQLFERELGRSIHVHVWAWPEMVEMVRYMVAEGGAPFELLEMYLPKRALKLEMIFVLSAKSNCPLTKPRTPLRRQLPFTATQREQSNEAVIQATHQSQQQQAEARFMHISTGYDAQRIHGVGHSTSISGIGQNALATCCAVSEVPLARPVRRLQPQRLGWEQKRAYNRPSKPIEHIGGSSSYPKQSDPAL